MRISDWSSDVCSSDLRAPIVVIAIGQLGVAERLIFRLACDDVDQPGAGVAAEERALWSAQHLYAFHLAEFGESDSGPAAINAVDEGRDRRFKAGIVADRPDPANARHPADRSEEHTSELQSLMRNSYAVFCLKKKKKTKAIMSQHQQH